MAYKLINYKVIIAGVINKLKEYGIKALDIVPQNQEAPFCYVELTRTRAENTKTSFLNIYTIWIHAFANSDVSSIPIMDLCQEIQEALTEDITIPNEFVLVSQYINGLNSLYQETETSEKHAVIELEIKICYGYKTKI